RLVEREAADAQALAPPERALRGQVAGDVPHAGEGPASVDVDAELAEERDAVRHDPFAARLVDDACARLDDEDMHAAQARGDGGGEARGAAARDDEVGPHASTSRRVSSTSIARSSTRIRTARSSAFSTVKESAVIQAVCTRGSAMP